MRRTVSASPAVCFALSAAIAALSILGSAALAQGAKPTDPQIAHIAYTAGVIDIEVALAKAEAAITFNVVSAAKKDWKAGAFWLKCRNRELYGDELTINQQVQRGVQDMLDDVLPHMSEAAGAELLHAIGKVMGVERVVAEAARGGSAGSEHDLH